MVCGFIFASQYITINKKKEEGRKKREVGTVEKKDFGFMQPGSWKEPNDWELHSQYIFEVFNPQTIEYSLPKPRNELKPGETLEEVKPSFADDLIAVYLPRKAYTILDLIDITVFDKIWRFIIAGMSQITPVQEAYKSLRTVRKTEQAPKLNDISVEEAPGQEKPRKSVNPPDLHQVVNEVINTMIAYQKDSKLGRLQSDHIMELYERAFTPQSSDRIFHYLYTDAERRSPFNYKQKKQNSKEDNLTGNNFDENPEPRIIDTIASVGKSLIEGLFYGGRILGDPSSSPIVPLSAAALFGAPKRCE